MSAQAQSCCHPHGRPGGSCWLLPNSALAPAGTWGGTQNGKPCTAAVRPYMAPHQKKQQVDSDPKSGRQDARAAKSRERRGWIRLLRCGWSRGHQGSLSSVQNSSGHWKHKDGTGRPAPRFGLSGGRWTPHTPAHPIRTALGAPHPGSPYPEGAGRPAPWLTLSGRRWTPRTPARPIRRALDTPHPGSPGRPGESVWHGQGAD